ncbi:MAG: arginase family protein, partial [Fidelibacterota bacterium]
MKYISKHVVQPALVVNLPEFDERDVRALNLIKPWNGEAIDLGILGVPFDLAIRGRPGARFAPSEVRKALKFNSTYCYDFDIDIYGIKVADL